MPTAVEHSETKFPLPCLTYIMYTGHTKERGREGRKIN